MLNFYLGSLEVVARHGKHKLVGFVDLGGP